MGPLGGLLLVELGASSWIVVVSFMGESENLGRIGYQNEQVEDHWGILRQSWENDLRMMGEL